MQSKSVLSDMLASLTGRGRALVRSSDRPLAASTTTAADLDRLSAALLTHQGEAMRVSLASDLVRSLANAAPDVREAFICGMARSMAANVEGLDRAIEAYRGAPSRGTLAALHYAAEPVSLELLRRINLAPGGTLTLVRLRETLLDMLASPQFRAEQGDLASLNNDFAHLFGSWFNRGFLVLKRIDWSTPASILERIIRYEAVHAIRDWSDLRSRIDPDDRRCFAFFHPSLVDEPLIFVEVALTSGIPRSIAAILDGRPETEGATKPTTAVFYSISNCQRGLAGVSFGDFLIKQVVEDLRRELPGLSTFVTLSPVPGLVTWLTRQLEGDGKDLSVSERNEIETLLSSPGPWDASVPVNGSDKIARAAARYLLVERTSSGRPLDPVARFHLGNGAVLAQINPYGDLSAKGVKQSLGVMVNYVYDLDKLDANQKAFAACGELACSDGVRRLLSGSGADKRKASSDQAAPRGTLARMLA